MPTISNDRLALKAAAALLLLASGGIARAGATIEIDPKTEAFATRGACEQALEKRRLAALARLDSLPPAERRGNSVGKLRRDGGEHLSYVELVDLGADPAETEMPRSQTEQFTCRGSTLEHRIDYGMADR
jgi:hypothetical protein